MMHDERQSHSPVVPKNPPNNAPERAAEVREARGLAKGNSPERTASRTPRRVDAPSALERVRQAAKRDGKQRVTALVHHGFDLWVQWWRRTQAQGDVVVVRFADDLVLGFEHREEAERFLAALHERFGRFGLTLHPEKTRLLEFGRYAAERRHARGAGKPATFNFLGFTHSCGKTRQGKFTVLRQTMRQRWQAKLKAVPTELRRRLHLPIPEVGAYRRAVVRGHFQYYGVPMNTYALNAFRQALGRLWRRILARRSQTAHVAWLRMRRLIARWLPPVRVCHRYPLARLAVTTQGKSRMR